MTRPTFTSLQSFLENMGFVTHIVPGSHIWFQHGDTKVRIALRLYEPEELVEPAGMVYVRHTLDAFGLMDREEFDEEMRQRSLAS